MEKTLFYQTQEGNGILLDMNGDSLNISNNLIRLKVNDTDASTEKHIPILEFKQDQLHVKVGSTLHPMTPEHYIKWIYLQTKSGGSFITLTPKDVPEAVFTTKENEILSVYAYCNIHGLWAVEYSQYMGDELVCSAEFPDGCI